MKFKLRNLKHWTSQNWLLFRYVVSLMDFSHHTYIFRFLKINYQRYRTKFFGQRTPQNRNKIIKSAGNIFGTNYFSKLLHTTFKNYLELFPKKPLLGSSTTMFRYLLWHLIWAQVLHDELVLQIHTERYLGSQVHFGICRPKVGEKWHFNHLWSSIFFFNWDSPMQCWTATTRHGVTRKKAQKRLQDTENLFRKNLQLKDVC